MTTSSSTGARSRPRRAAGSGAEDASACVEAVTELISAPPYSAVQLLLMLALRCPVVALHETDRLVTLRSGTPLGRAQPSHTRMIWAPSCINSGLPGLRPATRSSDLAFHRTTPELI